MFIGNINIIQLASIKSLAWRDSVNDIYLADYTYLGLNQIVQVDSPQPD